MTIRKWVTSSEKVMKTIPEDERATSISVAGEEKGESELVTAEADLWKRPVAGEDETPFPVMFRCTSLADPIVPLEWKLAQVSGSPSQITVASINHGFRLDRLEKSRLDGCVAM